MFVLASTDDAPCTLSLLLLAHYRSVPLLSCVPMSRYVTREYAGAALRLGVRDGDASAATRIDNSYSNGGRVDGRTIERKRAEIFSSVVPNFDLFSLR